MSDMYVYMYVYMYVCMHVCTKSFLKTTTNSSCVCTHLANKADSDSDSDPSLHLTCILTDGSIYLVKEQVNSSLHYFMFLKACFTKDCVDEGLRHIFTKQ